MLRGFIATNSSPIVLLFKNASQSHKATFIINVLFYWLMESDTLYVVLQELLLCPILSKIELNILIKFVVFFIHYASFICENTAKTKKKNKNRILKR